MKLSEIDFHLEKLRLEPGDLLVAKLRQELTKEHIARLRNDLEPKLAGSKCLVIGPGDNLSVMTAFEIQRRLDETAPSQNEDAA